MRGDSTPAEAPPVDAELAHARAQRVRVDTERARGEYGSVIFIYGNMPLSTEIVPLLIVTKLEQYDYAGATAITAVTLVASFVLLLAINALRGLGRRRFAGAGGVP